VYRVTSNIKKFCYRHTKYFCESYVYQEKGSIFLHDIKRLLFIVEMECVYYVLWTTSLNKNEVNLFFKDLNKLINNENVTSQVIIYLVPCSAVHKSHEIREFLHLEKNRSGACGK
jgi:hypothetical protein